MKLRCLPVLFALLSGCSSSEDRAREHLLDKVEGSIKLPPGASPVADYARYYGPTPDGKIQALYILQHEGFSEDMRRLCVHDDLHEFPCAPNGKVELVPNGQRKWVANSRVKPFMDGGGCANLWFVIDPATQLHSAPRCTGPY